jgi:hypothetical protein
VLHTILLLKFLAAPVIAGWTHCRLYSTAFERSISLLQDSILRVDAPGEQEKADSLEHTKSMKSAKVRNTEYAILHL